MRVLLFVGVLSLVGTVYCSPGQQCVPGKTDSCVCPGGQKTGVQSCKADGSGWDRCVCPGGSNDGGAREGSGGDVQVSEAKSALLAAVEVQTDANQNIDGKIELTWRISLPLDPRLSSFQVLRANAASGTFTEVAKLDVNKPDRKDTVAGIFSYKYIDTDVNPSNKYDIPFFYKVIAIDTDGKSGLEGRVIQAATVNANAPVEVQGIVAVPSVNPPKVVVSWDTSKEYDIKGYYVFRSDIDAPIKVSDLKSSVSGLVIQRDKEQLSWKDASVTSGRTYWYAVVAIDLGEQIGKRNLSARFQAVVP